jgi:hypothetical protein
MSDQTKTQLIHEKEKEKDRDCGWAEFFLPIQTLNTEYIQVDSPKHIHSNRHFYPTNDRPIAALWYKSPDFTLTSFTLLTTTLRVHSWDSATGRLELETDTNTAAQIIAIQKRILTILESHREWFPPHTNIQQDFQYMYHNSILTVYLHGMNSEQIHMGRVWNWSDGTWKKGVSPATFSKGCAVRLAIRFQGICFLKTEGGKIRYRIQHQTVAIYHKPTLSISCK